MRSNSHTGLIRLALAFAALLMSMGLVVWRQSRALELGRDLDQLRTARAIAESERSELSRRIEYLESRGRVVEDAARIGLRVPSTDGGEIVILPLRDRQQPAARATLALNGNRP